MNLRKTGLVFAAFCLLLSACDNAEQKKDKYIQRGNLLFEKGDLLKARLEYRNALRISPADAEARYRLALVDEAQGSVGNALAGFVAAERQNPHFLPAVFKLAQYHLVAGHYDDVRKRIDLILAERPDDANAHALRAALLLRLKNYDLGEKEAAIALQKDPKNIIAYSALAGIHTAKKDHTRAIEAVEEGIRQNPKELSLLLLKATLYAEKENLPKIVETYEQIFNLRPLETRYRYDLASIYVKAGKMEEAEAVLRKGVTILPGNWEMKRKLVTFLSDRPDTAKAEEEIRHYMKEAPDKLELYFWLAELFLKHNDTSRAVGLLEEIVAKDVSETMGLNARTSLARIRFSEGDKATAERLIAMVLEKDPGNADALFLRARLSYEDGDYRKTIADLRVIIRDRPKATRPLFLMAETLLNQKHVDLAVDTLKQLLAIDPADLKAHVRLAQLYAHQGDAKSAQEELSFVKKTDPNLAICWESSTRLAIDAKKWEAAALDVAKLETLEGQQMTALFLKGQILAGQGNKEDALPLFKQVIDADPSVPLAEHALSALVMAARDAGQLESVADYIAGIETVTGVFDSVLGECLQALGKDGEAAEAYDRSIAKKPPFQTPFVNRARLYLKEKKTEPALETLKKAQAAMPSDHGAALMIAEVYKEQGKNREAVAVYETLLARNPELDVAANNMAQLIADTFGNDMAALQKARVAAERFTNASNPYYLDTLGWVYVRLGDTAQALPVLERAIKAMNPPLPQVQYHYGALLLKIGRVQEARNMLTHALAGETQYPGREDAQELYNSLE